MQNIQGVTKRYDFILDGDYTSDKKQNEQKNYNFA